jgi:hypothetical protein
MNAIREALTATFERKLTDQRVLVVHDPRQELASFLDELEAEANPTTGNLTGELPRVRLGAVEAHIARFHGSFVGLKWLVEPYFCSEEQEPLLVYIGAPKPPAAENVLLELEAAGDTYSSQLGRIAREKLRGHWTDGEIDRRLEGREGQNLTYAEVRDWLEAIGAGGDVSRLHRALGEQASEATLARFLVNPGRDKEIEREGAREELYRLIASRLGLSIAAERALAAARGELLRFVLVNEFRLDLAGDPPSELDHPPALRNDEQRKRVREIALTCRRLDPVGYERLAREIEEELDLAALSIDPARLGSIDTFPFEERALLGHAGELLLSGNARQALAIATERRESFWLERDLERLGHWEACRMLAELGCELDALDETLAPPPRGAREWVEAYVADRGWHRVDRAHRRLEAFLAHAGHDLDAPIDTALVRGRERYERAIDRLARGFVAALVDAGWTVPGVLHQTRVFTEHVERRPERIAYVLVDSLRYEMGAELAEQLADLGELRLRPAIAVLPSITPLGMAALMPGAAHSYSVVEHRDKLAARVDGALLREVDDRRKHFTARCPGSKEIELGPLLHTLPKLLSKRIGDAPMLLVRSQVLDALGEKDGGYLARSIMDNVLNDLARAIRRLKGLGFEAVVVASDHGHLFAGQRGDHEKLEKPSDQGVEEHRRCWAGHGGRTPPGCVRAGASQLGYDSDLEFVFPEGAAVFRAGGGLAYYHGGASLQELVVPVLSIRFRAPGSATQAGEGKLEVQLGGLPEGISNRIFSLQVHVPAKLFLPEEVTFRLVLRDGEVDVGRAELGMGAEVDKATGTVRMAKGVTANIGLVLGRERHDDDRAIASLRIVALDATEEVVLARSAELVVKLGI